MGSHTRPLQPSRVHKSRAGPGGAGRVPEFYGPCRWLAVWPGRVCAAVGSWQRCGAAQPAGAWGRESALNRKPLHVLCAADAITARTLQGAESARPPGPAAGSPVAGSPCHRLPSSLPRPPAGTQAPSPRHTAQGCAPGPRGNLPWSARTHPPPPTSRGAEPAARSRLCSWASGPDRARAAGDTVRSGAVGGRGPVIRGTRPGPRSGADPSHPVHRVAADAPQR